MTPKYFRKLALFIAIALPLVASTSAAQDLTKSELSAQNIVNSVKNYHPLLQIEVEKLTQQEAKTLASLGNFDAKLKGSAKTYLNGFYTGRYYDTWVEKPLQTLGATVEGGYRQSDGIFPVYKDEFITQSDGEGRIGVNVPLLRNRRIDSRRGELRKNEIGIDISSLELKRIELLLVRDAIKTYWECIAASQVTTIYQDMLNVAKQRLSQISEYVDAGDKPRFDLTDAQRSALKRESQLVKSQRKLEQLAVKLSLFNRSENGNPMVPSIGSLPKSFPTLPSLPLEDLNSLVSKAVEARPELAQIERLRSQANIDKDLSNNGFLPQLDLSTLVANDFGRGSKTREDAEVIVGFKLEVPLQRNKLVGKLEKAKSKLRELDEKEKFVKQKISVEVNNQLIALKRAKEQVSLAEREAKAAEELAAGERIRFSEGDSTLLIVVIREQAAAEAQVKTLDSKLVYLMAITDFYATLGSSRHDYLR